MTSAPAGMCWTSTTKGWNAQSNTARASTSTAVPMSDAPNSEAVDRQAVVCGICGLPMKDRTPGPGLLTLWDHDCRSEVATLTAQLAESEAENDALGNQMSMMSDTIVRYERALEFYANPNTYYAVMFVWDPPCGAFIEDFSEDHGEPFYDRPMPGKTARATLAAVQVSEEPDAPQS